MRLLIAGWQGQIASALVAQVPSRDDVSAFAAGRPALDLCELPTLQRALSEADPDVIINAAAYTAVDQAETDEAAAFALNCDGARMLAELSALKCVPIVHLSTDYVFDGQLDRPYREDDRTQPQTIYGRSKLAGERAVVAANPRHIVLRTSWVFSSSGSNFVRSMFETARKAETVNVVTDQIGSPTYAPHLASVILDVAAHVSGREDDDDIWGTYHVAGSGEASWFDLAREVMSESDRRGGPSCKVNKILSQDYPTVAARLANSRLDCTKLDDRFGIRMKDWTSGVRDCVDALMSLRASP